MITITRLKSADQNSLRAINGLLSQLSPSAKILRSGVLKKIITQKSNVFLVLRDRKKIVGMGEVVVVHTLTGTRARIEDVVVEERYRRRGLGEKLVRRLIQEAHSRKAKVVELTSRPSRVAANSLYRRLGFRKRNTNVYRLILS